MHPPSNESHMSSNDVSKSEDLVILDVGGGRGDLAVNICMHVPAVSRVCVIDLNEKSLEAGRARLASMAPRQVSVRVCILPVPAYAFGCWESMARNNGSTVGKHAIFLKSSARGNLLKLREQGQRVKFFLCSNLWKLTEQGTRYCIYSSSACDTRCCEKVRVAGTAFDFRCIPCIPPSLNVCITLKVFFVVIAITSVEHDCTVSNMVQV